jgi:ABC-type branched-subunit amino acid transport system substrate-binding protein
MKRILFVCMLVSIAAFVTCMSGPRALADEKTIMIGCVGDFSGTYSTIASDQKAGTDMAIDEINSTGGILSRKLSPIYEDSVSKPALAATKTEKLILQDHAKFVIGDISSGSTLAMMKIAEKHQVLMLAPIAESVKITTDEKSKYVFRFPAHVFMTNIALAKWMIENAGPKIYLLSVDYDWGRVSGDAYREGVKKFGGTIVGETYFPLNTKDFAPYFGKIKSAHPDALLITSAGNDAISALTQLSQYGLSKSMKIGGAGSMVAASNLPALGNNAEGFVTVDYYAASLDNPANKLFRENYEHRFGKPPSKFSVMCYETMKWLAQVIHENKSIDDIDRLIATFEGSRFSGPQGVKIMDKSSHQALLPIYLITVKNGNHVLGGEVKY